MSSFYISAAHKSSGKTTLSIGLAAAIRQRGITIQTFKKGPDYIDPIWLGQASESPCYNLDFFTSSNEFIVDLYNREVEGKQVSLVEGNMGLYDGISVDGSDCNAAMAKLLGLPVILVVDCSGTSRGIAPLLLGYQQFDPDVKFAGVILNKLAGQRQENRLTEVIHSYTDFNVLGALPRNQQVGLTERHLGLIPCNEVSETADDTIGLLAEQVTQHVDIDTILSLPKVGATSSKSDLISVQTQANQQNRIRIAIARDKAFGFYYPGDLERFAQLNVELVPFDAASDDGLPRDIDGLFIGGGFPETQLDALASNQSMRESIKQAIETDLPTYAECGGLMYLCSDIVTEDGQYPMCDVIPASASMNRKPQGRGYVILQTSKEHPWYGENTPTKTIYAHEFHYSRLENFNENWGYAYSIDRGTGIDGVNDGIIYRNLVANYSHLRQTDQCSWVDDFVLFVDKLRNRET